MIVEKVIIVILVLHDGIEFYSVAYVPNLDFSSQELCLHHSTEHLDTCTQTHNYC